MSVKNGDFQPSLQQILEESSNLSFDDIDRTLLEYAVLSDDDLKKALHLDSEESDDNVEETVEEKTDLVDKPNNSENKENLFTLIHNSSNLKNQSIIQKFLPNEPINSEDENLELNHEVDQEDIATSTENKDNFEKKETNKSILTGNTEHKLLEILNEDKIIDLKSQRGKKIFAHAVQKKFMNIFYLLSQNTSLHVVEDSFLACFRVVLNAVEIERKEISNESDLECEHGFIEFSLALQGHNIPFESYVISKGSLVESFRLAIKQSCSSSNVLLVCCYYHKTEIHFSLVGGYYKEKDMLLLIDVVPMKYSMKWVALKDMWNYISDTNKALQGFYLINTGTNTAISLSHEIFLHVDKQQVLDSLLQMKNNFHQWLLRAPSYENEDEILLDGFKQWVGSLKDLDLPIMQQQTGKQQVTKRKRIFDYFTQDMFDIYNQFEIYHKLNVHLAQLCEEEKKMVYNFIAICDEDFIKIRDKLTKKRFTKKAPKKKVKPTMENNHLGVVLTSLLLFWSYSSSDGIVTNGVVMHKLVESVPEKLNGFVFSGKCRLKHVIESIEFSSKE